MAIILANICATGYAFIDKEFAAKFLKLNYNA